MPSNHPILCHPLLFLPSIFATVFSCLELVLPIRWPKYWSFSFSIGFPSEYLGLISFRIDQLDLLAIQGTLKSLLQHHSLKASILWHSALFSCLVLFLVCALDSLILTGRYHFQFLLFTRSIYCTLFLLDCFDFAYGCIYICVYSVTIFLVINLCLYVGLLQFCEVLFFPFFFSLYIFNF